MKATKRYRASEIVNYRKSNTVKTMEFDTLEEAVKHVAKEQDMHPRSKKFNPYIWDTQEKKSIHYIDAMKFLQSK